MPWYGSSALAFGVGLGLLALACLAGKIRRRRK